MLKKNRGYLLVDVSIAMAIFSILSFGIFTFYKTYKRIDNDNKEKVEWLNCINYMDYIYSELRYNTDFGEILKLKMDTDYFINIDNLVGLQRLNLEDSTEVIEKKDVVLENYKLKKFYIMINVSNMSSPNNYNDILSIETRVVKNDGQDIYKKAIKRYKYVL